MDNERARDLLANLLERARSSTEKIFLTSRELNAISIIISEDTVKHEVPPDAVATIKQDIIENEVAKKILATLAPMDITPSEIDPDVMLCIDFGTSFSKAFVSISNGVDGDVQLIELSIGDGITGTRLTAPSELFIDNDHIYFGAHARRHWDDIQAPRERLIDSIKQFITLNKDVSALAQRNMPAAQDPKQQFSQRDILVLYLAHLMTLTERAVEEKGLSKNIRRRFTHPAWKDGSKEQNEREMRQLMAEALLLSRSAASEFVTAMPLASARGLLDQLSSMAVGELPSALIGEPVREATAAGAGALLRTREGSREAYLVLDIGAGTTDVAGFYCVNNPNNERMRVFEVALAADAKNVAGNTLDDALQRFVMDKSGLSSESAEARLAGHALRRQVRSYKEQLFRTGRAVVELPTDQIVEVDLEEFTAYKPVMQFTKLITDMVASSAAVLAGDASKVNLVATGGGSGLPIVRELGEKGVRHGEKSVRFMLVGAMADELRQSHPDLVDPYPQIAVALGGSLPNLPEQKANIDAGLSAPSRRTLAPVYK